MWDALSSAADSAPVGAYLSATVVAHLALPAAVTNALEPAVHVPHSAVVCISQHDCCHAVLMFGKANATGGFAPYVQRVVPLLGKHNPWYLRTQCRVVGSTSVLKKGALGEWKTVCMFWWVVHSWGGFSRPVHALLAVLGGLQQV